MLNLIPKIKNTDSGNFLLICGPCVVENEDICLAGLFVRTGIGVGECDAWLCEGKYLRKVNTIIVVTPQGKLGYIICRTWYRL